MNSIKDCTATSQVVLQVYDFSTNLRSVFIEYGNRMVEAVGSRIPFADLLCFAWDVFYPERELSEWNLMLDCLWSQTGAMRMEILQGLLEMLPGVDPSTIKFTVYGKERSKGEPILWGGIGFILVWAVVRADCWPVIEDGRLVIYKRGESGAMELPDGCTLNGDVTPERKADKKAETKKPDLHIVPPRKEQKEKAAKHHKTPRDLLKFLKAMGVRKSSLVIFKALHKSSWYSHSSKLWVWHSKRHRYGRWCTCGIDGLVDITGLSEKCVKLGLKELKDKGVIYKRAHGRKGVSNTIWELGWKMDHVNAWKRKPKGSK